MLAEVCVIDERLFSSQISSADRLANYRSNEMFKKLAWMWARTKREAKRQSSASVLWPEIVFRANGEPFFSNLEFRRLIWNEEHDEVSSVVTKKT